MAKNKDKEIKVSFCPKCKSYDVKYIFGLRNLFGTIPKMKCGKCGLESIGFPILVISEKALAKSKKSREKKK